MPKTRVERAERIASSGGIVRSGESWLVPSTSSEAVYRVALDGEQLRCTCPDFQRRHQPCKHIIATAIVAHSEVQHV